MVPEKMLEAKALGLLATTNADVGNARFLAREFYKEMRESGFTPEQMLTVSNELLELVAADLKARVEAKAQVEHA